MIYTIIFVLLLLWVFGFLFEIAGGLVHTLLVIALVVFIYDMVTKRRASA